MTRRALVLLAGMLMALPATAAHAQAPSGIARPTPSQQRGMTPLQLGAQLFAGNCASCHGNLGRGQLPGGPTEVGATPGAGPPLLDAGALAADFYLRTGYMPLDAPGDQPQRHRVPFTNREVKALVAYVASLGHGPPIPRVDTANADLGHGRELFTEHCAGCHQVVAQGGVVTGGRVPPLEQATATQVAQAIRIGPYLMPAFTHHQLSDRDVADIARYVEWTHRPDDAGGLGLGNLGPFPEGIVTWFVAIVALIATCVVIAHRRKAQA